MGDAGLDDQLGLDRQISSCIATMSCGYWMIGRPSQEKLYEYLGANDFS